MLRIDKVTKEFPQSSGGRKRVLEDLSLKFEDTEFVSWVKADAVKVHF